MSTKKKSKTKPQPLDETSPEPTNTAEPEIEGLRRCLAESRSESRELLSEKLRLAIDVAKLRVENSQLDTALKFALETNERLLTALIADNDALKVYREQALTGVKRRLADREKRPRDAESDAIWSAFKWEPISYPRP